MVPETRYAKSGQIQIAHQVLGDGPIDLVILPGLFGQVELPWEEPGYARFLSRRLSPPRSWLEFGFSGAIRPRRYPR